jgi:hypothetical protein
MAKGILEKIHNAIRKGQYDLTHHAVEEMAEDGLTIFDVEKAILKGKISEIQKDNIKGNKHVINGIVDEIEIGTVGRFKETGVYLIITVYRIED